MIKQTVKKHDSDRCKRFQMSRSFV
ncbi:hypothetical protein [Flavobacterium sp. XS2P39]